MSNDLISRSELMKNVECDSNFRLVVKCDKVVNAPTAYDVDAVCEALENNAFWTDPTFDEDGHCDDTTQ